MCRFVAVVNFVIVGAGVATLARVALSEDSKLIQTPKKSCDLVDVIQFKLQVQLELPPPYAPLRHIHTDHHSQLHAMAPHVVYLLYSR